MIVNILFKIIYKNCSLIVRSYRSYKFATLIHPCLPYCLAVGILHFHVSTDYILSISYFLWLRRKHFDTLVSTPLTRDSRWGQDSSSFPCWFSIIKYLGFNHISSKYIFFTFVTVTLKYISILCCGLFGFTSFQHY